MNSNPVSYVPPSATQDAGNRAWRTFAQGLLVDVVTASVAVVAVAVSDIEWTEKYWLALAALVGKTVVTSAVSYLARTLVPPNV